MLHNPLNDGLSIVQKRHVRYSGVFGPLAAAVVEAAFSGLPVRSVCP